MVSAATDPNSNRVPPGEPEFPKEEQTPSPGSGRTLLAGGLSPEVAVMREGGRQSGANQLLEVIAEGKEESFIFYHQEELGHFPEPLPPSLLMHPPNTGPRAIGRIWGAACQAALLAVSPGGAVIAPPVIIRYLLGAGVLFAC